ncbi:MAG: TIGR03960 family B12-binding radical SAM protein [Clostridia bacterium]|nr:TIGR03960 family B12-binding radical SAM protein [Clostridia bacterium]
MDKLDLLLRSVQKPARYIGNEVNSIHKNKDEVDFRMAMCFPDVYEVGMSHLGLKILYGVINEIDGMWCERVFCPHDDMEQKLKDEDMPLFALESGDPITHFDALGFTLQTEMSFTNVLNILQLGHIPLRSEDRGEDMPFVIGGGPCAYNPEPVHSFFDMFNLGEGEEMLPNLLVKIRECKKKGLSRLDTLKECAKLDGIYVPSFYEVDYNDDGTIKERRTLVPEAKDIITKQVVKDLSAMYYPDRFIVPFCEVVHDRAMLEVFRGCTRGCRFCQAGQLYRPIREKSVEALNEQAKKLISTTGYEEMSLTSLSTSDYTKLFELIDTLNSWCEKDMISLSLPSLRVDNFSMDLMDRVQKVRKGGLTFAPEAGSQRMRDIINKNVTEEQLRNTCRIAFKGGWHTIKLYFMMGLPYETEEDVMGIGRLGYTVLEEYFKGIREGEYTKDGGVNIRLSVACFIPKPFTPFQWVGQDTKESLRKKQIALKGSVHSKKITVHYHDSDISVLEAVLARGDRRLAPVIETAFKNGCKMDNWDDHFKYDVWLDALEQHGLSKEFYANRVRDFDEILPWDFIDIGVSKAHLVREAKKSMEAATTPDCRTRCQGCGADKLCGGYCHAKG